LAASLQNEENVEAALKRYEAARLPENYRIIERAAISAPICRRPARRKSKRAPGGTAPTRL
jgi:2-polyprenyl-6-methoxyphenol hydroxylase-like FAD-dependent oxidoreductase